MLSFARHKKAAFVRAAKGMTYVTVCHKSVQHVQLADWQCTLQVLCIVCHIGFNILCNLARELT